MALFNREDENPDVASPPSAPVAPKPQPTSGGRNTYIGPGVKIKGEISADVEMVVDGEVQGRLELKQSLTVGSNGVVNGDIIAKTVQVGGSVVGNVRGTERFELLPSGRIEGDVVSPRVVIAEGAFFKGKVEVESEKAPSKPAASSTGSGGTAPKPDNPASETDKPLPGASTGTGTVTGGPK
jgi:cytoskeletal protein CcmA (bactofilin family)